MRQEQQLKNEINNLDHIYRDGTAIQPGRLFPKGAGVLTPTKTNFSSSNNNKLFSPITPKVGYSYKQGQIHNQNQSQNQNRNLLSISRLP